MKPASAKEVAVACRARRGTILSSQTVLMACPSETSTINPTATALAGGGGGGGGVGEGSVRDNLEHEVLVADGSSVPLFGVGVRQ